MFASTELTPNCKHRAKNWYECIHTKAVNSEILNNFELRIIFEAFE